MADGINTSRIATAWFGDLPEHHLSITQQRQFFFGQSWPTLLYLPSILGVDATLRRSLGLDGITARAEGRRDISEFVEEVAPHEVAHQWWGHLVGWRGYRDQWLSEGFAQFSASLVLESAGGPAKFNQFWERSRQWILKQPRGSTVPNDAAGPIAEGWRLATRRSPSAYDAIVYAKGAYVLHMLRMQMRDWKSSKPDEKFIEMMKDFAATYAGKNPSTRDFQAVVERHMIPALNLSGDGKMDWFFRQWVDGVDIPRLSSKISIAKAPDNQYHLTGSISQDAVPAEFKTAVHLYVEFAKGDMAHLGVMTLGGVMTTPLDVTLKLSKEPKRALLNAQHDVLSRD
jgi:aminopeptidase N